MNPSFSSVNKIPISQSLPNDNKNTRTLTWNGKTVYALYIPKEATTPNTHPKLLAENNNDYSTTFEVLQESFAEINLTLSQLLFNGKDFSYSFGDKIISDQYLFNFETHTLHDKNDNFSHTMTKNEKINIISLKSTFIKNALQLIDDMPPSYNSLFPHGVVDSWV
jgi:hypothetical protein